MKTMNKKLLLLSLALITGLGAFAQVKVGIKAGVNFADLKYEPKDQTNGTPDANSLTSFNAGVIVDVPVVEGLSFQPGVMLEGKGSKVEHSGTLGTFTQKVNPLYVEVPANFLFKPTIGKNTRLYFGLGPYVAIGVGGKSSTNAEASIGSYYSDHTLKFGNGSDDDLKSTDFGGNILAGFEFGDGLILGAQYGMSFTNNAPDGNNDAPKILRNKVLSISIGYFL
ncbi:MAG TPA: porin family protein [Chitinophagaceae bacterium]|jgi:hypothetical protein|nr:porin family protein [Chitinophagaceae bacterium]